LDISFVVRESPIINDATLYDALSVGLDGAATIISSGSDAPATILSQCSQEMLDLYHSADVIISKGQGNYESLSSEQVNIFFLLKAKCQLVARQLGVNVGDAILMKQQANV
ncbi:MAG: ARMT1-like domain-containing protein, partial [Dehalococcoidia bacterium]